MEGGGGGAGATAPEGPSWICEWWREKIVEWKYALVDRFGEAGARLTAKLFVRD